MQSSPQARALNERRDEFEPVAQLDVDLIERSAPEFDHGLRRAAAQGKTVRPDVTADAQYAALAIDEHNVDRTAHSERMDGAARRQPYALVVLHAAAREQTDSPL